MKYVFVGGTGRCGTTVLWHLLATHPEIASLPVRHRFIIDPEGLVSFLNTAISSWSPFDYDRALGRLEELLLDVIRPHYWRYPGLALEQYLPNAERHARALVGSLSRFRYDARWVGQVQHRRAMEFHKQWDRAELAARLGAGATSILSDAFRGEKWFVDGDTWNILYARELFEMFPESKMINIVRDPLDVVSSMKRQGWCPRETSQAVDYYCAIMDRWKEISLEIDRDRLLTVKLEYLPDRNKCKIEQICEFLGIVPAHSMYEFKLDKVNEGRWRRDGTFTMEDLDRMGNYREELGYR
jgi:hypothetical protein